MPTLVTVVERSLSVEQEVRDDTMVEQIKETKRGGIERDKGLRKMKDWGNWGRRGTKDDVTQRERERERDVVMWLGKNKKLQDVYCLGTRV